VGFLEGDEDMEEEEESGDFPWLLLPIAIHTPATTIVASPTEAPVPIKK
jgi:hypothetical protein